MAKIIRFPTKYKHSQLLDEEDEIREQCLSALRMLYDGIASGEVEPSRMIIAYSDWHKTLSYLNLGFPLDDLVKGIDLIIEDQKANPD